MLLIEVFIIISYKNCVVYNMLINECMTKLTLNIIGTVVDLLLLASPQQNKQPVQSRNSQSSLYPGKKINGWICKEIKSPFSGCTHRYLYHPCPHKNAPVFLFLHGLVFDARNFLNLYKLADTWQLIAYDFPESSPIYRGDMNDFRFLIDDFLDTLKIDTLYLCGVSFGGGIALRYAASHARRIKSLVLASTFIINSRSVDRIKSRELALFLLKHPDHKLNWLIDKILNRALSGKRNPIASLKELIHQKKIDWYRQVVRSITTCEGTEDAVQVNCPVLSLCGDKDKLVPLHIARSISRYLPHCQFEVVKGGNHAMMYFQGNHLSHRIHSFCSQTLKTYELFSSKTSASQ